MESRNRTGNCIWWAVFAVVLCLQMLTLFYYGNRKAGFHEDEYYSYYSSNRTAGLFEPDREWMDRDAFRNEFVVLPGEGFNYGLVAMVQSWDVHPPFFYFILHTACSLFPGMFSKWLGIGVNMIAFAINFMLLSWLVFMVTDRNKILTLLVAVVHGWNGVIISGVMFIRMYEWLTVFVLLCACLHVHAMKRNEVRFKTFLVPLMAVTYLGFLTQYYYIIFLFFMAAGFCLWLLIRDRKIGNCIKYGMSCGAALGLAVISYPACLSHIFRGYRGTGAASEFLDTANTGMRLRFFAGLMNEYMFDGYLWLWLILIGIMAVILFAGRGKRKEEAFRADIAPYLLLLFTVCGYFFAVSKTALLLYETSNRYQLPVYGILLMLVIVALYGLGRKIINIFSWNDLVNKVGIGALFVLFLVGDIHGLVTGKVIFLYEDDRAQMEYARENAHETVVVLYNDITSYNVWWCAQELMQYDRIYFASEGNKEKIEDDHICGSNKMIVYAADHDTKEESLDMLLESNPGLKDYRLISTKSLWSVYEFE